jgi:hypothetical protein
MAFCREEHVMPLAMALAVVVHIAAFVLFRFETSAGGTALSPRVTQTPEGMRVVQIIEVAEDTPGPPRPEPPDENARGPATPPIRAEPPAAGRSEERADPGRTITDRISPIVGDARLFAEQGAAMPEPTNAEAIARARLLARIDDFNNANAAADAAAAAALDWTYTDGEGKKWGFSPGKILMGGLTLPLPIGFSVPPGRRDELAEKNRRFGEIQDQRARETGRQSFDERVKAIRERTDAKRDSTKRSGGGS